MSRDKRLTTYLGVALVGIILLVRILWKDALAYFGMIEWEWKPVGIFVAFVAITVGTVGSLTTWWSGGDDQRPKSED